MLNFKLLDIATMNPNTENNNDSVSKGMVYFGFPKLPSKYSEKCVCCVQHGAMLAVSKLKNGDMLYRCEVCNNGCIKHFELVEEGINP